MLLSYDFLCPACGAIHERRVRYEERDAQTNCPSCHSEGLSRVWTKAPGIAFRGSALGFTSAADRRMRSNKAEEDAINRRAKEAQYDILSSKAKKWVENARPYNDAENEACAIVEHREKKLHA